MNEKRNRYWFQYSENDLHPSERLFSLRNSSVNKIYLGIVSKLFNLNIDYSAMFCLYYSASKLESIRQSGVSGKLKIRQSSTSSNMNLDETQTSIPRVNSVGSPSKPHIFYPLIIKISTLSESYL